MPAHLFRRSRRRVRICICFLAVVTTSVVAPAPGATATGAQQAPVHYEPPVAAPVTDGFRPPVGPYGPGNRGIEYDTEPGGAVLAAADGRVVFAGPVGSSLHVTVLHADGVRTSYAHLARVDVRTGQQLGRGDPLGRSGDSFHWGARVGGAYVDPAGLLSTAMGSRVELLPLEVAPGARPGEVEAALGDQIRDGRGPGGVDLQLSGAHGLTQSLVQRVRLTRHYVVDADPIARTVRVTRDLAARLASTARCRDEPPASRPVAGQERRALLIGGLGSTSESASIDGLRTDELGYGPGSVERFSYTGDGQRYGSTDTQGDLLVSAAHLADSVERAARASPHAIVDVYAHSMGGVVARLALLELERRGFDLHRLGLVATIGSPHRGADLATAVAAANVTVTGNVALDVAEGLLGTGLDPDGRALAQLSEASDVVRMLDEVGVPDDVELVSVAASGDLVVAAPNTRVDGARNITVSLTGREAHSGLVEHDETTAEIARALAGQPQGCEAPREVVEEEVLGHGISYLEDVAGFAALNDAR